MNVFSLVQLGDLADLRTVCRERQIEVVIIGAMAYRLFIDDADRETRDIDFALALDLEDMAAFAEVLARLGWHRVQGREHRWQTARRTWMDLLPAGPSLRAQGQIKWPESGRTMSLAGFEHVFRDSVDLALGPELSFRVVPPTVLALLKMVSYLDDPSGRAKDLLDLQRLWRYYEENGDRLFSDDVFRAELPDIEFAGAFLLGLDTRPILTPDDRELFDRFFSSIKSTLQEPPAWDLEGRDTTRFQHQVSAFQKGLRGSGS